MRRNKEKKTVVITLKIRWLLYDIMNETYLRGQTIQTKENYKEVGRMFASEDEGNREKILRSVKRSFTEIETELEEYLQKESQDADNQEYNGHEDLSLELMMPSNFSEAATDGVEESIHSYIVNRAIGEWYMVTNKPEAEQYYTLAMQAMEKLRIGVSKRRRPMRPNE